MHHTVACRKYILKVHSEKEISDGQGSLNKAYAEGVISDM